MSLRGLNAMKTHSYGVLLAVVLTDSNLLVDIEIGLWLMNKPTSPLLVYPSRRSYQMRGEPSASGDRANFILLILHVARAVAGRLLWAARSLLSTSGTSSTHTWHF